MLDSTDLIVHTDQIYCNMQDIFEIVAKEIRSEFSRSGSYSNIKPVNVRIAVDDVALAKLLGRGNISAGVRVCLRVISAAVQIEQNRSRSPSWRGFMGGRDDE